MVGLFDATSPEPVLGPGKPLALLVYLALTPGRRASRESLIELLWADLEPERARGALRQAVFHLRRLLGDGHLSGSEELSLSASIETDRDHFVAALENDALGDAIDLYVGAFLPSFGVPGGAGFEHWADLERGRLQASFVRAGELLVRRQLNRSDARSGKRVARLVRDRAPHDEAAWRLLLEAAISTRDFMTAAVEAEAFEEWAAAEQATLEPATLNAIARARRIVPSGEQAESAEPQPLVADLTGREREFFAITTAWAAVREGSARHLHLTAPAGLGKTRLLRDAIARLAAVGAPVVQLRGKPGDRELPFAFAADLAGALAAMPGAAGTALGSASTLLALNPAVSSWLSGTPEVAPGHEVLRRRIHALADLMHAVADEHAFVLAIDDVHWIDAQSLRVLDGLLARLDSVRVLCLTAARPEARIATDRSTSLPLAPLTIDQVGSVVEALGTLPASEEWARTLSSGLHAATSGSPLLVLETLRLAIDQHALILDAHGWKCLDASRLRDLLSTGEALRERVRALAGDTREVLLVLSIAGIPLDRGDLAAMVQTSPESVATALASLEQQGLVVRAGSSWAPAHDEIASAARDTLAVDARAAIERVVGEHLARTAGVDQHALLRAARHLIAGGDGGTLRRIFAIHARLARSAGDRRKFTELAFEFTAGDTATARALAMSIPPWWRAGLWSRARLRAAVAALVLVPALGAGVAWTRAARDAGVQRLVFADSAHDVSAIFPRDAEWDDRGAPVSRRRASSRISDRAFAHSEFPPAISPDGRSAAWVEDSGDSTTLDIWIHTPSGTRRLTRAARDDLAHDWLPDGSALVGTTSRWSPLGQGDYDIALYDTATGAARQITHGRAHDTSPHVSPDGTRIAFQRETGDRPEELCVVPIDGSDEPECRSIAAEGVAQVLGWTSPVELAVIAHDGLRRPLLIHDWVRNRSTEILGPQVFHAQLSADHRWIVAALRRDGIRGMRDWVIPVDRPNRARPVATGEHESGVVRWWEGRGDASNVIDRLDFADTARTLPLGVTTRLRVRPFTAANVETPIYARVAWTSSDTNIAFVDSVGEVRPLNAGGVTITASLAGWRRASRTFHIVGERSATVLAEQWDARWTTRWIPWGDPLPSVSTGPGGLHGLANNGDGSFPSMAFTRRAFDARNGLGVELRVSTPLTNGTHQRMRAVIVAGIDTAAMLAADQRKAPPTPGRQDAQCGVTFPQPGAWGAGRVAVLGGSAQLVALGSQAASLGGGGWWTLRLQILPDGRCGVAINGRVVSLSPDPIPLDGEFRIRLGDESVGTTLLHGPLTIWTGVRTDIDWSQRAPSVTSR